MSSSQATNSHQRPPLKELTLAAVTSWIMPPQASTMPRAAAMSSHLRTVTLGTILILLCMIWALRLGAGVGKQLLQGGVRAFHFLLPADAAQPAIERAEAGHHAEADQPQQQEDRRAGAGLAQAQPERRAGA